MSEKTDVYFDNPAVVDLSDCTDVSFTEGVPEYPPYYGDGQEVEEEQKVCRRCVSPINAFGFSFLIVSGILCGISIFSPFWIYYPTRPPVPELPRFQVSYPFNRASWRGLWAVCYKEPDLSTVIVQSRTPSRCAWFGQQDNAAWGTIPSWYDAAEVLFAIGMVLLLLALIVETVFACCHCGLERAWIPTFVASLTFLAGIMCTASLGLFGDKSFKEGEILPEPTGKGGRLEWAFHIGIAGTVISLFTSLLFYIDACRLAKRNSHCC